jgi:hypothetical protein
MSKRVKESIQMIVLGGKYFAIIPRKSNFHDDVAWFKSSGFQYNATRKYWYIQEKIVAKVF